ncbi:MAG: hypothetical protein A2977_03025 [Alphaproteobacteria bacterium RIFCSPLOWO2_01_FULL_45_8]|nr:MAG: hypothetical protein A2065_00095 [Alphaproteobacteria bacterium GWB1_45_5]OFW95872.1 MAG: hypothetical protein A2977_03025 [Alphaproteobacteria bacterium RIFCSPLOWO2_01_FULL_45_8]HCI48280.1 hypothetical protein [Holosporales bacterium]
MLLLVIVFLDPTLFVSVIEKKKTRESYAFSTLEEFLSSPLWTHHKETPRVVYLEQESFQTLCDLRDLSPWEKALFWIQKKTGVSHAALYFLSWHQAFFFHPTLPASLKKGPLLKTSCVLLDLLKTIPKRTAEPTLFFYFHPALGLWQCAFSKTFLFTLFTPPMPEEKVEDHVQKSLHEMRKRGFKEGISSVPLSSPLEHISPFSSFKMPPTYLHKTLAAGFLFVLCVGYTLYSLKIWEAQLHRSRQALRQMETKINTPEYRKVKAHFGGQK